MKECLLTLFLFCVLTSCQKENVLIKEIKDGQIITANNKKVAIPGYEDPTATTFFLVRHAEKGTSMDDPELNPAGLKRALNLEKILSNVKLNLATSTNYNRTTQTANPVVFKQKCDIKVYDASEQDQHFTNILNERKGQKVLVVGHSNTIPRLLNFFKGENVYMDIDENTYDNFYIVSAKSIGDVKIIEAKY